MNEHKLTCSKLELPIRSFDVSEKLKSEFLKIYFDKFQMKLKDADILIKN